MHRLTSLNFIEKATEVHGNKYDYTETKFINHHTKVEIICHNHGKFEQGPWNHLYGSGCTKCATEKTHIKQKRSLNEFVDLSNKIHNYKYDYSRSIYENGKTKTTIICKLHGEFLQSPEVHLCGGGCQKCSIIAVANKNRRTIDEYIEKAKEIHNNFYDYSEIRELSAEKIKIICPKHGIFNQIPSDHLNGSGCRKCANISIGIKNSKSPCKFINESTSIHGNKYNYSKTIYTGCQNKIIIVCPEHGEFSQRAGSHSQGHGCPRCGGSNSTIPENEWLDYMLVPRTPETRQVNLYLNKKRFKVDGYNPETKTIYEFWGDFWHGNPKTKDPDAINEKNKKTFGELYEETQKKRQLLGAAGYNLVEIWGSDWAELRKEVLIDK